MIKRNGFSKEKWKFCLSQCCQDHWKGGGLGINDITKTFYQGCFLYKTYAKIILKTLTICVEQNSSKKKICIISLIQIYITSSEVSHRILFGMNTSLK